MAATTKKYLADLANDTLGIIMRQGYRAPSGAHVDLTPQTTASLAGSRYYPTLPVLHPPRLGRATTIECLQATSIGALEQHAGDGHVAILNFASAKNPGGGCLRGTVAQEESLAYASTLYASLIRYPEHYQRNRDKMVPGKPLYLDQAIWTPSIAFFRDDHHQLRQKPLTASVITIAAPNRGAYEWEVEQDRHKIHQALVGRARFCLALAAQERVDTLILGAWGCGVFKNDPVEVATIFRDLLQGDFGGCFHTVCFAIPDSPMLTTFGSILTP